MSAPARRWRVLPAPGHPGLWEVVPELRVSFDEDRGDWLTVPDDALQAQGPVSRCEATDIAYISNRRERERDRRRAEAAS